MSKFKTYSQLDFDILKPDMSKIKIEDIARALSMQCRFNGHVPNFYSVAEHSVRCSWLVEEKYKLSALLHDAAEAYLGDVITPVKQLIPQYKALEENIEQFIATCFGLIYPFPKEVITADNNMLQLELKWCLGEAVITPVTPRVAESIFLAEFNLLMQKRRELNGVLK